MTLWRVIYPTESTNSDYRREFLDPKAKKQRALPCTRRLHGGKGNVKLTDAALAYWAMLNDNDHKKMKYLLRRDSGIINKGFAGFVWKIINSIDVMFFKGQERPKMEQLVFGGAILSGIDDGGWVYVDSLNIDGPWPTLKQFPPVIIFRAISQNGTVSVPDVGTCCTFPCAHPGEQLRIEREFVVPIE